LTPHHSCRTITAARVDADDGAARTRARAPAAPNATSSNDDDIVGLCQKIVVK